MTNMDIQKNLNILGAKPPLKADGKLGPMSIAAIKSFQASHGLAADGVAGAKTKTAIYIAVHPTS
jgi:putative chitinase